MLFGVAAGATVAHFAQLNSWPWWLLVVLGSALALPAFADVAAQWISPYRSNCLRRGVTGLLLGVGVVCIGTTVRMAIAEL